MKLLNINVENFRNIENLNLNLNENLNIFYGDNAQGKTNLLESIWFLTGMKSFRLSKDIDCIKFGQKFFKINAIFEKRKKNDVQIYFDENKKKRIKFNGVYKTSLLKENENLMCVVFSPTDLYIVKDYSEVRRRFLDSSIIQLKPMFKDILSKYKNLILNKNSILKNQNNKGIYDIIELLNSQIADVGTFIHCTRQNFLNSINLEAKGYYNEISKGLEKFDLKYKSDIFFQEDICYNDKSKNIYFETLNKNMHKELKMGFSIGVHRDDFSIFINDTDCKKYSSQGQQRSCVLSLKLGLCNLFKKNSGFFPIVLLDDVMSELDSTRTDFILQNIKDKQVIITSCDKSLFETYKKSSFFFHVKKGELIN